MSAMGNDSRFFDSPKLSHTLHATQWLVDKNSNPSTCSRLLKSSYCKGSNQVTTHLKSERILPLQ